MNLIHMSIILVTSIALIFSGKFLKDSSNDKTQISYLNVVLNQQNVLLQDKVRISNVFENISDYFEFAEEEINVVKEVTNAVFNISIVSTVSQAISSYLKIIHGNYLIHEIDILNGKTSLKNSCEVKN